MIQQQTMVDIADNSGAKQAMCIRVLGGSTSSGKMKRRVAGVGDVIICAVKKALPTGEVKQGDVIRCVVVRTKQPIRRSDGSYVRFDHNAAVIVDADGNAEINPSNALDNITVGTQQVQIFPGPFYRAANSLFQ